MKKMLGLLLAGMILIGSVGCESKEEHEARVIEAVENKIEARLAGDADFNQITNRQWTYSKTEDGQEIVTLTGVITYGFSFTVVCEFYVNDGYISKMTYTFGDNTETYDVPKSENSKLDL